LSAKAQDSGLGETLWSISEEATGIKFVL